jgi:CheY-like chemotaxis protein
MKKVLIVASPGMVSELDRTILWRGDIERVFAADPSEGRKALNSHAPTLVILADEEAQATLSFMRDLRNDDATRHTSLVVMRKSASLSDEHDLRRAGANVVFAGEVVPYLWDAWLEELLNVPRRREARVPVALEVWSHLAHQEAAARGQSLNISVKGMLLETPEPLDIGAKLDLSFRLPDDPSDLRAVAQVVREEHSEDGHARVGVEFLILRDTARERIRTYVESEGTPAAPRH